MADEPLLLTPEEAGHKIRLSATKVRQMCADGEIGHVIISRRKDGVPRYGITPEDIQGWLRRNRQPVTVKRSA